MFNIAREGDAEQNYKYMIQVIETMIEDESDIIANLSNISAVINAFVDRLNWVGFYILKDGELVLGPFQGAPACVRIKLGKGVCGTAAINKKAAVVPNVHEFPGHIACDSNTNSEIVIPIFKNSEVFGVLDLDSPDLNRFTELESKYLSQAGELLSGFLSKNMSVRVD